MEVGADERGIRANATTVEITGLKARIRASQNVLEKCPFQRRAACLLAFVCFVLPSLAADRVDEVKVNWKKVEYCSRTTPTLQVVANPLLRQGSPIYQQAFRALGDLHAEYVRFVPWFPYPQLGVAELKPPDAERTYDRSFAHFARLVASGKLG